MKKKVVGALNYTFLFTVLCLMVLFWTCRPEDNGSVPMEEIAANEEVLTFMKTFDGRGALSDSSQPTPPSQAVASFRHPDDIDLTLVLSEPEITQPVHIHFDHRGRLWVAQYNQYPYPKDLKVTSMDQHIRATFDKVPPPPGQGPRGADKITFFEDTDMDGVFDKSTDAITGLNIATSVALGRGKIWVLNPPYLLAYPDADDDGVPDAGPEVHLEGFGLEDTHAVANNLRWGPDGWLYGAQGSTCTANISSAVSKNVKFDGQAIWRYHPQSRVFEIFAEGGGNTFDVEIDAKGRIYSGDNGTARGQYYKQGGYYVRNFGKHGALTNPYAFGFLSNMALTGEKTRFTHAFIRYEENNLPDRYRGHMIALNPLQGYVQLSRFEANGSTFAVVDESRIMETDDHWFRPVDVTTGPDGAVYIADWYDSRLSHVDPRDTWSKKNGRIYRLGRKDDTQSPQQVNVKSLRVEQLVDALSHPNRWQRRAALNEFADRHDRTFIPLLMPLLQGENGQLAMDALCALHLSGGLDESVAITALRHADPFVRLWAVRLVGEMPEVQEGVAAELAQVASAESHPEVRSQLAATCRRLPGKIALPMLQNLLLDHDDADDPDLPLQIWWALESKTITDTKGVLHLLEDPALWKKRTVRQVLLERLMQRYALAADSLGYASCARLIALAPSAPDVRILLNGLQEGLRGRDLVHLPPVLARAIERFDNREYSLVLALRQGDKNAITQALAIIADSKSPIGDRLAYTRTFGEINAPESVPVLLNVMERNESSPALKQTALQALQRYNNNEIGQRVVKAYPDKLRADPGVRLAALSLLATRAVWAQELLNAIARKKQPGEKFIAHTINKQDVPDMIVRQLKLLDHEIISAMTTTLWPDVRLASAPEITARIGKVSKVLQSGTGNAQPGHTIFVNSCGACHRLFDEGGTLGPDLTGYARQNINDMVMNIVDPNAYIREGYVTYRFTVRDGRVLTGTVVARNGTLITLNLISGETITLPEVEIKDMQAQPSLMPDNILERLTDQQIRDLFAYLARDKA